MHNCIHALNFIPLDKFLLTFIKFLFENSQSTLGQIVKLSIKLNKQFEYRTPKGKWTHLRGFQAQMIFLRLFFKMTFLGKKMSFF